MATLNFPSIPVPKSPSALYRTVKHSPGEAHAAFGFGALLLTGGVLAFYRRRSAVSLVASSVFAGGFFSSGLLIADGKEKEGHFLASVLAGFLAGTMGYRVYATGKYFPGSIIAGLGAVSMTYHCHKYLQWSQ